MKVMFCTDSYIALAKRLKLANLGLQKLQVILHVAGVELVGITVNENRYWGEGHRFNSRALVVLEVAREALRLLVGE
jgi:hypothetical protein